jgi:anti-sigma-K factor RskA
MNNSERPDPVDEAITELMAGYVLGNLSTEEEMRLEQWLSEHPEQVRELISLQEALDLLPYTLPAAHPPKQLDNAIFELGSQESKKKSILQGRILPWGKITSAIAALVIGAFAWSNVNLKQNLLTAEAQIARQKDVVAMLQNPETHLVSLKGMNKAVNASGRVIMTPGEPQSVLILQNLPTLPIGKYYQLWSIVNGKKVPSGQFNARANGTVLVKLPTPSATEVSGLLITLEESARSQAAPGDMVMTSSL